jgi:hypothetical protein
LPPLHSLLAVRRQEEQSVSQSERETGRGERQGRGERRERGWGGEGRGGERADLGSIVCNLLNSRRIGKRGHSFIRIIVSRREVNKHESLGIAPKRVLHELSEFVVAIGNELLSL